MSRDRHNQRAVLATMHKKERVMAPLIEKELGFSLWVPNDFDTDAFGTFTREKARQGTQLEAARAKARAAMERYGYQIGVASEGSFGVDPILPLVPRNVELVVLIDDRYGVEVVGQSQSRTIVPQQATVHTVTDALATASAWGFPEQGVIVRRSVGGNRHIYKDVIDLATLATVVAKELRWPWVRSLTLETDMRAHRHVGRLAGIEAATADMVRRYRQRCPQCSAPGFVATEVRETARCQGCDRPTDVPYKAASVCQVCSYVSVNEVSGATAVVEPGQCARCNP